MQIGKEEKTEQQRRHRPAFYTPFKNAANQVRSPATPTEPPIP